ncbi:HD domain-containing phosphohydrolase [Sulfurimonas sp.]|uniref:HD domain-containing phosphohydrolase n=1 Tax=Sulfurimonas sp. TaxID=2022749 RepID=UPI0025E1AC2C|nr:HD domain-containing phosphohydrolase [Sulfurimonas sp.]MBW6488539.1 transporter substrate-binding domain-containing protein [Sulfurimonas sp.]
MKLLFTILFFLTTITADETKEFRVGVYDNPPKIFLNQNNRASGFFVDILNEIAKRENWRLNYVKCEWRECLLMLEDGRLDIMPDVAYSKEREKRFRFQKEVVLSNWSIILTNKKSKISSILDLDNKKIALLKNSIQHEQIKEIFELFDVKPIFILTESYEEAFSTTLKGKADAVMVNRHYAELNKSKFDLKHTDILVNPAALKFAFSNSENTQAIIDKIDMHLRELKSDKESIYYKSNEKWLKEKESFHIPTWLYITFIIILAIVVLLITAVTFFKYMLNKKTREVIEKTEKFRQLEEEKVNDYQKILYALVLMIEQRDSYTAGHSGRVANYSSMIAREMGYSDDECALIYKAGILHDIGKIATPDSVLLKPDKLSELEYDLIKEHVIVGYKILRDVPMFRDVTKIIKHHHERYDGGGYPDGLIGNEIPPLSRIMMVADAFDAITTNRIYKHKKSVHDALIEIESLSKIHYHPEVVKAALKALSDLEIADEINQNPITAIEQQRFAYFYKDAATELYNIKFLEATLLGNNNHARYDQMVIVSLHKFDIYNKKYGWEVGDKALREFASLLRELFNDALIFRVRANDFIVLLKDEFKMTTQKDEIGQFTQKRELEFSFNVYNLKKDKINSYNDLKKVL